MVELDLDLADAGEQRSRQKQADEGRTRDRCVQTSREIVGRFCFHARTGGVRSGADFAFGIAGAEELGKSRASRGRRRHKNGDGQHGDEIQGQTRVRSFSVLVIANVAEAHSIVRRKVAAAVPTTRTA